MSAPWLIVLATLLFAAMGAFVKLATAQYAAGEIVFYRCLVGAVLTWIWARSTGGTVATRLGAMHFWRSLSGVVALCLWFYAIGNLPLATATTLNYMSSVWMALFLVGGAIALGTSRVDGRLIATVLIGFLGVALILRPTIAEQQLWHGLMGLLSGVIAAVAYLQVTALGRTGEPDYRIVFWFSIGGVAVGGATILVTGFAEHTWRGIGLLAGVGLTATGGQMLMTRAYTVGATLVNASLQYLGIAWSFILGVVLFDDKVTALAVAGMLLIAGAGLAATVLRTRNSGIAPVADSPNTV